LPRNTGGTLLTWGAVYSCTGSFPTLINNVNNNHLSPKLGHPQICTAQLEMRLSSSVKPAGSKQYPCTVRIHFYHNQKALQQVSGSVRSNSTAGSNHSVSTAAVTSVGAASNPSLNAAATLNGLDVSHGSSSSSPVGPGHTVSAVMTLPTNSVTRDSSGHLYQIQEVSLLPMKDHQMESFVIATQPSGNSSGGMDLATLQPPPPHQSQPFLELTAPPPPQLAPQQPTAISHHQLSGGTVGGEAIPTTTAVQYTHPHQETIVLSAENTNSLIVPNSGLARDAGQDTSPQTKRFYQVIQDLWGLLQHGGEATLSVDSFTKQFVELKTSLTHSSGYSPNLLKALNNFGKTAIASPAQGSNTVAPPTACKTEPFVKSEPGSITSNGALSTISGRQHLQPVPSSISSLSPNTAANNGTTPTVQRSTPVTNVTTCGGAPGNNLAYASRTTVAPPPPSSGSKRKATSKKTRCGTCKGCQNFDRLSDCKSCRNCLDQKRYGGPGKLKKACLRRLSCDVVCKGNTKTQTTSRQQVHPPAQLPHAVKQQPPPPPAAVVSGSPPPQAIQPQTVTTGQTTEIVLPLHPVPLSAISTTTFNSPVTATAMTHSHHPAEPMTSHPPGSNAVALLHSPRL